MKKKVLTFGVFDYFHYGHLQLFKKIKKAYPDCFLTVAVQEDEYIQVYKPDARILYTLEKRLEIIRELKCVDEAVAYGMADKFTEEASFDVLAVGEDQNSQGMIKAIKWAEEHGKELFRLTRTPNISSSFLKGKEILSRYGK